MAYLQLGDGLPPFNKAVISLWFRFPATSVAAVRARGDTDPVFARKLPLLTFGARQTHLSWTPTTTVVPAPVFEITTGYTSTVAADTEPCFIGLLTNTDSPTVWINLQTAAYRTVAYGNELASGFTADTQNPDLTWVHQADIDVPGSGWSAHYHVDVTNYNQPNTATPETFEINTGVQVAPDRWHHILLSFDLSNPVIAACSPTDTAYETSAEGVSSFCKIWYAVDDVNYSGADFMGNGFVDGQDDPNAVVPSYAIDVANYLTGLAFNNFMHQTTYSLDPGDLPTDTAPLGIPVSEGMIAYNTVVEMAELQIYTDVTADTSNFTYRRAFVTSEGRPETDFTIPDTLFGKTPEVRLHGRSKWQSGANSGGSGDLAPTGTINAFSPGPSLT